jgi:hypothetical protein
MRIIGSCPSLRIRRLPYSAGELDLVEAQTKTAADWTV